MRITPGIRAVIVYVVVATPLAVLVFLFMSAFFVSWDGRAVSTRPTGTEGEPSVYRVLIVNDDGTRREESWPPAAVKGLGLPVDSLALPPRDISERPRTRKPARQMFFLVEREEGVWAEYPTTSPMAIGMAALLWLLGLALRNMVMAGSPLAIEPRQAFLPTQQAAAGQPASGSGGGGGRTRGRKGPPPGSTSKKNKRRRR